MNQPTAAGQQLPNRHEIDDLLGYLTPDELTQLDQLLNDPSRLFWPLPGPQSMAYESEADVIGYGGAAGGGKSFLAIGKALTQHHKVMILRREANPLGEPVSTKALQTLAESWRPWRAYSVMYLWRAATDSAAARKEPT